MAKYPQPFAYFTNKPIDILLDSCDTRQAIFIENSQPLIKAFATILRNGITGVAVVDSQQKILGNISASDMKGMSVSNFWKLDYKIDDLLQDSYYRMPPLRFSPQTPLSDIISEMATKKVHRVYIVDEQQRPQVAVTMSTVINILAKNLM